MLFFLVLTAAYVFMLVFDVGRVITCSVINDTRWQKQYTHNLKWTQLL